MKMAIFSSASSVKEDFHHELHSFNNSRTTWKIDGFDRRISVNATRQEIFTTKAAVRTRGTNSSQSCFRSTARVQPTKQAEFGKVLSDTRERHLYRHVCGGGCGGSCGSRQLSSFWVVAVVMLRRALFLRRGGLAVKDGFGLSNKRAVGESMRISARAS